MCVCVYSIYGVCVQRDKFHVLYVTGMVAPPFPPVIVSFSAPSYTVNEGDSVNLTVQLNQTLKGDFNVTIEIMPGTASECPCTCGEGGME